MKLKLGSILCLLLESIGASLLTDLEALNLSPGTTISTPANPSYATSFKQRWSRYDAPSYIVAVKPLTEEDVISVVKFAANSSVPFLATGGGHGFSTTLSHLQQGLNLDLGNFRNVSVDGVRNTMMIGGATRFGDVVGPLGAAHKELPIGAASCVGMVGATLGGGVGRYNGLHGMLLDSLLSVRMITANGTVITASTTENSDLFWGIRGAGFQYGIILEATYKIYNETAPSVLNADLIFAPNASTAILEYFKALEDVLPPELTLIISGGFAQRFGGAFVAVNAVYIGPRSEGERLLQPIITASPLVKNLTMVSWSEINAAQFFGAQDTACAPGDVHNVYGSAIRHFDIVTFQDFFHQYNDLLTLFPQTAGSIFYAEFFPKQGVRAIPENSTSYPWRDITAHILMNFSYNYNDTLLDSKVNQLARDARANFTKTSGFQEAQVYVNYGHGDEAPETLYSAQNLPHLRQLKLLWDPTNMFRYQSPL